MKDKQFRQTSYPIAFSFVVFPHCVAAVSVWRCGSNVFSLSRYDCVIVNVVSIAHGGDNLFKGCFNPDPWFYGGQTVPPEIISHRFCSLYFLVAWPRCLSGDQILIQFSSLDLIVWLWMCLSFHMVEIISEYDLLIQMHELIDGDRQPRQKFYLIVSVFLYIDRVAAVSIGRHDSNVIFFSWFDCVVANVISIAHGGDICLIRSVYPDPWIDEGQTAPPETISCHPRCCVISWLCGRRVLLGYDSNVIFMSDMIVWLSAWFSLRMVEVISYTICSARNMNIWRIHSLARNLIWPYFGFPHFLIVWPRCMSADMILT